MDAPKETTSTKNTKAHEGLGLVTLRGSSWMLPRRRKRAVENTPAGSGDHFTSETESAKVFPEIMPHQKSWIQNPTLKFVGMFFTYVLIAGFLIRLDWVDRNLIGPYTVFISHISGAILDAAGVSVETWGTIIRHPSFSVDIRRGCDGIVASTVLISACLAFPLAWKMRILGSLLGYILIFVLNLVRVVGLFYAGLKGSSQTFEFFHVYVSQFGVIALAMVFWIYWVGREKSAIH